MAALLLLHGCANHPMGLTRAEWEALPPERRAELRAEQYRIDAAERARRAEASRQWAAANAAAERESRARLAERRSEARYGDIVIVTLQGGTLEYRDGRYPLQPVAVELVRGERRPVKLVGVRPGNDATLTATEQWWVSFSEDGNTVVLDDSRFGARLPLVNTGNWEKGAKVPLDARGDTWDDALNPDGMTATVRYKPTPGMPGRIIVEEW